MRLGNLFEGALLEHVRETKGFDVWVPPHSSVGPNKVQGAHLDGMAHPTGIRSKTLPLREFTKNCLVVECKVTNSTKGWGNEHTDKIPWEVTIQVQHQLYCTGLQKALVPVLMPWGGRVSVRTYEVRRDEEIIQSLSEEAQRWWAEHIVAGTPPMNTPSMFSLKERQREEGKSVELAGCLLSYYQDARGHLARANEAAEHQKAILVAAMDNAEIATFGGPEEFTYFKRTKRTRGKGPKYHDHCDHCGVGHKDSVYPFPLIRKAK